MCSRRTRSTTALLELSATTAWAGLIASDFRGRASIRLFLIGGARRVAPLNFEVPVRAPQARSHPDQQLLGLLRGEDLGRIVGIDFPGDQRDGEQLALVLVREQLHPAGLAHRNLAHETSRPEASLKALVVRGIEQGFVDT